jgi:nucleotide-binding universal stress UspA family protein
MQHYARSQCDERYLYFGAEALDLDAGIDLRVRARGDRDRDHPACVSDLRIATDSRDYDRGRILQATLGGPMFASIVVGTDGSETARTAVGYAIDLARQLGARLMLVSAYEPVSDQRVRDETKVVPKDLQWMVNPREDVMQLLAEAVEHAKAAGLEQVETFARQGDAADAILDVAEEQRSDLIVVGNKGMTGAKRFLLGSVPNKVSHHAPCSVLIVRTT